MLLYVENDFVTGTMLELEDVPGIDDREITVDGEKRSAGELKQWLLLVNDIIEYQQIIRGIKQIGRHTMELQFSDPEIHVDGDSASVRLFSHVTFYYENDEEISALGDQFEVHFGKIDGVWYIVDVRIEEHEYVRENMELYDFKEYLAEFLIAWANQEVSEYVNTNQEK